MCVSCLYVDSLGNNRCQPFLCRTAYFIATHSLFLDMSLAWLCSVDINYSTCQNAFAAVPKERVLSYNKYSSLSAKVHTESVT